MISRLLKPLAISLALGVSTTYAQRPLSEASVLTDALVFHGPDITGKENVDVYVSVPYQSIQFQQYDGRYAAQLVTSVVVRDSIGRKLADTVVKRSRIVDEYNVTQGATGASENIVVRFLLRAGSYRVEMNVKDLFAHRDRTVTDTLLVPDLSNTPVMSSLMYVSQIEDRGGRYSITPYVGRTIWDPELLLFTFFEYYCVELPAKVAFSWSLSTADGRKLGGGLGDVVNITKRISQQFIPLRLTERALPGTYTLEVDAHPLTEGQIDTSVILASRTRPYVVPRSLAGSVLNDLTTAIKQLAYVATQSDIDVITSTMSESERLRRFEEFWKKQDPTPRTVHNEAFDEYYARIATANRVYKSYADGWMTDMGRVYIIYGDPINKEKYLAQAGAAQTERWIYPNNQVFIFEDTGFGDYRLRSPLPPDAKYRYK